MRLLTLALPFLGLVPQDEDVVMRVLKDEMDRSMKRLKMGKSSGPYYLEYGVTETRDYQVRATFGALAGRGEGARRRLAVDVRVGDYSLDNTNFAGGGGFDYPGLHFGGGNTPLTVDDDYDALRHAVWLATDAGYKEAVEGLEKKKAYLQENNVKDRPDDLSREEPHVAVGPLAKLELDRDRWAETARRLSGVFRDFPAVQNSIVLFMAEAENKWFVNSEGFRNRRGGTEMAMVVLAVAQADDGMKVSDYEAFVGHAEGDLPSAEAMEKAARAMGERLAQLARAPHAEEYRGPILLEGQAAAEFFSQALAPNLGNAHDKVGRPEGGNPLKDKIDKPVLSKFLTIVDDPTARAFKGAPVLGGWEIDDDGVRAQKVTLVEKGVLRTFCMGRIPTRHVKRSNGHSRGGAGAASTLFVESSETLAAKELREKLIETGKEEGLTHVYVARRVSNMLASALNPQALMGAFRGGGGGVTLLPPVLLYRVSVADGKEELVRGAKFGRLTLRVLRDIEATGDDVAAWPTLRASQSVGTVVTPSLLLKEIEINKPGQETEKPPVMKNPFFEK